MAALEIIPSVMQRFMNAIPSGSTVIPCLRYRDALAMIDWLCNAFGFEKHAVHADGETVHHAQLTFGTGMIMLGSADNLSEWGKQIAQPDQIGLRETQSPYLIVADPDAHCMRAKAAGAQIVLDIKDEDYGGRGYCCRDQEGHLWNFGSYDPWQDISSEGLPSQDMPTQGADETSA